MRCKCRRGIFARFLIRVPSTKPENHRKPLVDLYGVKSMRVSPNYWPISAQQQDQYALAQSPLGRQVVHSILWLQPLSHQ